MVKANWISGEAVAPVDLNEHGAQINTNQSNMATVSGSFVIAETVVSGAVATSVDFTGLNIDFGAPFLLTGSIENDSGSSAAYKLTFNGLNTVTDYQCAVIRTDASTSTSVDNDARLTEVVSNGEEVSFMAMIYRFSTGTPRWTSHASIRTTTGMHQDLVSGSKDATVSNITSLRIASSVLSGMALGSKFKLQKWVID